MGKNNKVPEEKKGKKCFIITPIGDTNSPTFRKAKGVIESVIKPVLLKYGFDDIKPAYEILESGMIGNQIINRIVNDDLVVANLTGNNPNVMYELAIRHAVAKPIIHICEKGTNIPFDIKDSRTAFYTDDMLGTQELQDSFEGYVANIDYSSEYVDNPIYSGMQMGIILKKMDDAGRQTEAELLQKILDKVSVEEKTKSDTAEEWKANRLQNTEKGYVSILIEIEDAYINEFDKFRTKLRNEISGVEVASIKAGIKNYDFVLVLKSREYSFDEMKKAIERIAKECDITVRSISRPTKN